MFEQSLDRSRPHALIAPDDKNPKSWAHLQYRYLDTGEIVEVPNVPYNRTSELRAKQCRFEAQRFLRSAEHAAQNPLLKPRDRDYEVARNKELANKLMSQAAIYDDEAACMRFGIYNSALPEPDNVNMPRTVLAWHEYLTREAPVIKMLFDGFTTVEQFYAAEEAEQRALYTLQSAYYFDTSHINSRDDCRLLALEDIARTVKHVTSRHH